VLAPASDAEPGTEGYILTHLHQLEDNTRFWQQSDMPNDRTITFSTPRSTYFSWVRNIAATISLALTPSSFSHALSVGARIKIHSLVHAQSISRMAFVATSRASADSTMMLPRFRVTV